MSLTPAQQTDVHRTHTGRFTLGTAAGWRDLSPHRRCSYAACGWQRPLCCMIWRRIFHPLLKGVRHQPTIQNTRSETWLGDQYFIRLNLGLEFKCCKWYGWADKQSANQNFLQSTQTLKSNKQNRRTLGDLGGMRKIHSSVADLDRVAVI